MTSPQTTFTAALLDPTRPAPEGLADGHSGRRFDVYRNNVAASLTEALITAFPTVTKLLGEANMRPLATLYLRAHPPSSPLMMHYGAAFPDFLASLEQLQRLGYLPDIARLELALRRSYHAADARPIDPQTLAAHSPEALLHARLTLAPAVELARSNWPIHAIWRFNTEDGPQPPAEPQDVLITRPLFDPIPHLLPPGAADWIAALQSGQSIADALDAAPPGFDPAASLTLLVQGQAITQLTL